MPRKVKRRVGRPRVRKVVVKKHTKWNPSDLEDTYMQKHNRIVDQPKKSQPLHTLPKVKYNSDKDKAIKALHAGKRVTAWGTTYYERRKNRADRNRNTKY